MTEPKPKRRRSTKREEREENLRVAYKLGLEAGRKAGATFDADTLKQILALVHPDKHSGSAAATYIFAKVSAARDALSESA